MGGGGGTGLGLHRHEPDIRRKLVVGSGLERQCCADPPNGGGGWCGKQDGCREKIIRRGACSGARDSLCSMVSLSWIPLVRLGRLASAVLKRQS